MRSARLHGDGGRPGDRLPPPRDLWLEGVLAPADGAAGRPRLSGRGLATRRARAVALPGSFSFDVVAEAGVRRSTPSAASETSCTATAWAARSRRAPGSRRRGVCTASSSPPRSGTSPIARRRSRRSSSADARRRLRRNGPGHREHDGGQLDACADVGRSGGRPGPALGGPHPAGDREGARSRPSRPGPKRTRVAGFRAISVPTLLVAGAEDQVGHPAGMRRVADMITGCELAVVSRAAHYPWAENPDEFNRHFFGFLGRHFGPGR